MRHLILFLCLITPLSSYASVKVGYAKVNVNPSPNEAKESCIGGYTPFSRCGITAIHSDISVRALALSSGRQKLIIASIDTIGIGDSIIEDITDAVVQNAHGKLAADDIVLTATHTHNGPDLQGLWGGVSPSYRERIVTLSTNAILKAYFKRQTAHIYVTTAAADVENRRGWDVVDTAIKAIEFKSAHRGRSIATLIAMSAHPTIVEPGAMFYSADYPGSLRSTIEKGMNTQAIFVNAIVGDAQAATGGERSVEIAEQYGIETGQRLLAELENRTRVKGSLRIKQQAFTHPVANEQIVGAVLAGLLDLDLNNDLSITTAFKVFEIGNKLSGILFPGEALTRLAMPLRDLLPGSEKLFIGLAGDSLGYFLPSDEFLIFPDRTSEEQFSAHPFIGDNIAHDIKQLIEQPYHTDGGCPHHKRPCKIQYPQAYMKQKAFDLSKKLGLTPGQRRTEEKKSPHHSPSRRNRSYRHRT